MVPWKDNQTLLFNTRNHALVELDDDTLRKYDVDALDADTAKAMSRLGFFTEDDVDELKEMRKNYEKACIYHPHMKLTIMTTERCNFRCPYCYQSHDAKDMTLENGQILGEFLKKIYRRQTHAVDISWFGGEPLLNVEPIFLVEKVIKELKFEGRSHMTTNGFLLTDNILERFRRETRISSFQVTLDGTEERHNATRPHISGQPTYKVICENIQNAASKGFFITIRLNMNRTNQNLDSFFRELERLHLDKAKYAVHITNAHNFPCSEKPQDFYFDRPEEYSRAYSQAQEAFRRAGYHFPRNLTKKVGCEFECNHVFLVGCDLNLYFCSSCELSDYFKQGYIDGDGSLCLNENYGRRRDASAFHDEECRNCIVLPMCMGACAYCRIKGDKHCIPEKYILDEYVVRLYKEAENQA